MRSSRCRAASAGSCALHSLAVPTNRVHLVVNAGEAKPEAVVTQLKQWGTRRLRESGVIESDRPVWSRHASTRQLFKDPEVHRAVRYTLEGQDRHAEKSTGTSGK
ncbi:MAG: hypothetical protein ACNA8P_04745 [Phycisphaerales bacterium]